MRISIQQQTPIVEIINSMLDPIYRSCQNVALKLKQIVVFEDKQRPKATHDLIIKDLQHILFNPENTENDIQSFLNKYASFERFITYFN